MMKFEPLRLALIKSVHAECEEKHRDCCFTELRLRFLTFIFCGVKISLASGGHGLGCARSVVLP